MANKVLQPNLLDLGISKSLKRSINHRKLIVVDRTHFFLKPGNFFFAAKMYFFAFFASFELQVSKPTGVPRVLPSGSKFLSLSGRCDATCKVR